MATTSTTDNHKPFTLQTMFQSKPPPHAYIAVLSLGAVLFPLFLFSNLTELLPTNYNPYTFASSSIYLRRSLFFIDTEKYSTIQSLDDIDPTIESNAESRAQTVDESERCKNIFIYLPDMYSDHGHGSQLNNYIHAVAQATYLNMPMVLLENPSSKEEYPGGSQFGCPIDAFQESRSSDTTTWEIREDFPMGLSRLIQHPAWLSQGCPVPCQGTHGYNDWRKVLAKYEDGDYEPVTCTDPETGRETNVVVFGGSKLRVHFRAHERLMVDHSSPEMKGQAVQWALNLGASPEEAEVFWNIQDTIQIYDFVTALMVRSGILRFQPWIARDIEMYMKSFDMAFDSKEGYDGIHVRRGDKLIFEARRDVVKYWRNLGYANEDSLPTDYIPFTQYLNHYKRDEKDECVPDENGNVRVQNHNVYVATDDPVVVKREIEQLASIANSVASSNPQSINRNSKQKILFLNQCHRLTFHFNPSDDEKFHINEGGDDDTCFSRYHRNVASIADLMILGKSNVFVGEFNSNWGRLLRTMRTRMRYNPKEIQESLQLEGNSVLLKDGSVEEGDGYTMIKDTRVAWGPTLPRFPGY